MSSLHSEWLRMAFYMFFVPPHWIGRTNNVVSFVKRGLHNFHSDCQRTTKTAYALTKSTSYRYLHVIAGIGTSPTWNFFCYSFDFESQQWDNEQSAEPYEKDTRGPPLHKNMASTHRNTAWMSTRNIYTFLLFFAGGREVFTSASPHFSDFSGSDKLPQSESCEQSVTPSWDMRGEIGSNTSLEEEGGTKSTTSITSLESRQL